MKARPHQEGGLSAWWGGGAFAAIYSSERRGEKGSGKKLQKVGKKDLTKGGVGWYIMRAVRYEVDFFWRRTKKEEKRG